MELTAEQGGRIRHGAVTSEPAAAENATHHLPELGVCGVLFGICSLEQQGALLSAESDAFTRLRCITRLLGLFKYPAN